MPVVHRLQLKQHVIYTSTYISLTRPLQKMHYRTSRDLKLSLVCNFIQLKILICANLHSFHTRNFKLSLEFSFFSYQNLFSALILVDLSF